MLQCCPVVLLHQLSGVLKGSWWRLPHDKELEVHTATAKQYNQSKVEGILPTWDWSQECRDG